MFVLFLVIWMILNGRLTWEVFGVALALCVPLGVFFAHFMKYSIRTELRLWRMVPWAIKFVVVLIAEIVKANFSVLRLVLSAKYEPEPVLFSFRTKLRKETMQTILANSITLTPGTITVDVTPDGRYVVHSLDREIAQGTENGVFVQMITQQEEALFGQEKTQGASAGGKR